MPTASELVGRLRARADIAHVAYYTEIGSNAALDREAAVEIERLEAQRDKLAEALTEITTWAKAYPLKVFPEPDFAKVRELLAVGGITVDAVSASNMRHVLKGVSDIARSALADMGKP